MIAPGFSMVSEDGTFGLADLKAAGYSPSTKNASNVWSGGCATGQFELKVLKSDGTIDGDYYYVDAKAGKEGTTGYKEYPAGWYTRSGTTYTKIADADLAEITFNQGQAFWVKVTANNLTLASSGAVPVKDVEFLTVQNYHIAAGNGMPVKYTLGDLKATGYTPSTKNANNVWSGGCATGQFDLKFLKADGTIDQEYYYVDAKAGKEGTTGYKEYPAGWYTRSGTVYTKIADEDLAKIEVPAGQGFWIKRTGTNAMKLFVPAPELDGEQEEVVE